MIDIKDEFEKMFIRKTDVLHIQFFRYLFAGGLSFVVDFMLLYFFTSVLGVHYLISAIIGCIGGFFVCYIINRFWVFSKSQHSEIKSFLIFLTIWIFGLGLTELILYVFTDLIGLWYIYSKIISTGIVLFYNFLARKIFVF